MAKRHTAAAAACLLLAGCLVWAGRKRTVTYLPDESAFPNAQIGYAPGVLDSGTSDSLKGFQKLAGLPITGTLDRITWHHLARQFALNAARNNATIINENNPSSAGMRLDSI